MRATGLRRLVCVERCLPLPAPATRPKANLGAFARAPAHAAAVALLRAGCRRLSLLRPMKYSAPARASPEDVVAGRSVPTCWQLHYAGWRASGNACANRLGQRISFAPFVMLGRALVHSRMPLPQLFCTQAAAARPYFVQWNVRRRCALPRRTLWRAGRWRPACTWACAGWCASGKACANRPGQHLWPSTFAVLSRLLAH